MPPQSVMLQDVPVQRPPVRSRVHAQLRSQPIMQAPQRLSPVVVANSPQLMPLPPQATPHSWREALAVAQTTASVSQSSPQPVAPAHPQHLAAPLPQAHRQPVQRAHAKQLAQVPSAEPAQWKVPQQPAPASQSTTGVPQADLRQRHARVQAALANAQNGSVAQQNANNDHRHHAVQHKGLRSRMWRSVAWFGAMTTAFAISFGATVAPAYLHGHFNQPAQADPAQVSSRQTATAEQPDAGQVGSITAAGTLEVAGAGNTLQGTASQTAGDMPAGYKQTKTMYKSVGMTIQRQSLPTSYNGDPTNVRVAAENLKLQTTPVQTAHWGTAYIAESQGVQLALLANSKYLAIVQAQGHLDNDEWKDFLDSYDGS